MKVHEKKADDTPLYRVDTILLISIVRELLLPSPDGIQTMVNLYEANKQVWSILQDTV